MQLVVFVDKEKGKWHFGEAWSGASGLGFLGKASCDELKE
jgi:hypothetical protein